MNVEDSVFKYIELFADVKSEMKVEFEEPEITNQSQETILAEQAESEIDNDAKKLIIVNWLVISIIILGLVVFIFLLLSFNMQLKRKKNRH